MNKVAVFGKPGSGKSSFCKKLAEATQLPLYALDSIMFNAKGQPVEKAVFEEAHIQVLQQDTWIIDGLGPLGAFYQRLAAADTLIYIDLPYPLSYYLVSKRLIKGLVIKPEGWPEGSSIIKGSWQSYKFLRMSPKFWNDDFNARLNKLAEGKALYHCTSLSQLKALLQAQ